MRKKLLIVSLLASVSCLAQTKKVGDYIESFTNNAPSGMVPRQVQYYPEDGGFVCVNGKNRYTRALYGSHTDYRIETSDKPVFALYKSKNYRNVRFLVNGVQLDEGEYCKAVYANGTRYYTLRDKRWGEGATLTVECVMMHEAEGGYWHLEAKGFGDNDITLKTMMCQIANTKLRRNGDIGADKAGSFEPSPTNEGLVEAEKQFSSELYVKAVPHEDRTVGHVLTIHSGAEDGTEEVAEAFNSSKAYFATLASRISFTTPDKHLNTLGATLTLAADGAWDGETWLHGAIGWRMPLAGWRAGYLGDVLGWNDRAVSHFDAYANSQVTNVPPTIDSPSQDPAMNLARAEKKWGTQMYSNGYICRNPNRNNQMHHYDMNLNYVDELLWHFQYDADTAYMRKMWPVLKLHLEWEKRNFDKDNNHLYDAYCCIWASDALYYNGGEVTHSTSYNYRGNLLAAKIARLIGENPEPYQREADAILKAMNARLWVDASQTERYSGSVTDSYKGHWAEYRDVMGLGRLHPDAALWSVYTPIDCGVGTPAQMYSCTEYVDKFIPHIPVEVAGGQGDAGRIVSTSDWMPYSWSINNVASAETMHTALAFFRAGRADKGYALLRANVMDQMYLGASPGNLGQVSYYDAARGESYRDFGDNIGISSRAIVQGLFGIVPQALDGQCVIRPGFPLDWDNVEVNTPYLSYKYNKVGDKGVLRIVQNFTRPLQIVVRVNGKNGSYKDYAGTAGAAQEITFDIPAVSPTQTVDAASGNVSAAVESLLASNNIVSAKKQTSVAVPFNASVTDIFRNEYLSPRPQSTSLEIPTQGIGEWCHPKFTVDINDSVFRAKAVDDKFIVEGVTFFTPQEGKNTLFASLWDNYPESVSIPLKKARKADAAALLIAGSTNHMQIHMDNAIIVAEYIDGSHDTLRLRPPYNYCPIEQDYFIDGKAFRLADSNAHAIAASSSTAEATAYARPLRVSLSTGKVSRSLGDEMGVPATEVYGRELKGGAAQVLTMPLDSSKKVKQFTLRCLSNDIVVGIMGITLLND